MESATEARRRHAIAVADKREIEVRKLRSELLDARAVEREWADTLRQVRAGVLAAVSRIRARVPHLTAHDAQVIDTELRAALAALGEQ